MEEFTPPGDCPVCGEFVGEGAVSCKSCGSCPQSGWREESFYDGLDLPEDFTDETYSGAEEGQPNGNMLTLAAVLLVAIVLLFFLVRI